MAAPKSDLWLASALEWLEQAGLWITLFTNGMIVSGEIIGPATYFQEVGELLGNVARETGSAEEPFSSYFSFIAQNSDKSVREMRKRRNDSESELPHLYDRTTEQHEMMERLEPNYIHLRNTTAIMGGNSVANIGYWRGRLSEVAGWCFGKAQTDPHASDRISDRRTV